MPAPEPEEIFERTREEGRRRLSRPPLELAATALVGGFDVAFGVAFFGIAAALARPHFGSTVAHLVGSLAFGVAFVFILVGRSELFTENFLVPIAGLQKTRGSFLKLGELWAGAFLLNLVGGAALAVILTTHGVLRGGTAAELRSLAEHISGYDATTAFVSAVAAGALMTFLTWLAEGAAETMLVRLMVGWIVGSLLVLGTFDHAVVGQIELVFGMRYGASISVAHFFGNLGLSVAGNLVGGLGLVTLTRLTQAGVGNRTSRA